MERLSNYLDSDKGHAIVAAAVGVALTAAIVAIISL